MLSPKLKQQVSALWDMFWSGGMTNPLTSIEQITYLIFLKRLETLDAERRAAGKPSIYGRRPDCELEHHDLDNPVVDTLPPNADPAQYEKCKGHSTCRWSYLRYLSTSGGSEGQRIVTPYDHMNSYVFPWLRVLHKTLAAFNHTANGEKMLDAPMDDAFFQFPKEKTALFQTAIEMVDNLFKDLGHAGENDIMGDIFEYLLSEIQTSGKNGQFRTPRHIIRFLIELIQPGAGDFLVDPTAGTCGFLINTIQYLKKQYTSEESLVLEWDGTPHRTYGENILELGCTWEDIIQGKYFVGYDNERVMVRIGWMNMILHGIENPHIVLRDSLGRSLHAEESGKYDRVLANPPYKGTIDKKDLNRARFPGNPRKSNEPITNKSELLFTWLILDLLARGGKAAVIVPEGVLFGSSNAHKELRRQLLFEHNLEGVISLPAGVFNPYTGVKTSVLVFQKGGDKTAKGKPPRTQQVWFYEVTRDGYDLGAKRDPDYSRNDLWDAFYKWPQKVVNSTDYFQPHFYDARWRLLDDTVLKLFPELRHGFTSGREYGIEELFRFPDPNPKLAEQQISEQQRPLIELLYRQRLDATEARLATAGGNGKNVRGAFEQDLQSLNQLFSKAMDAILENKREWKANTTFGRDALQPILNAVSKGARDALQERAERIGLFTQGVPSVPTVDWEAGTRAIVREFAKLDGYDIKLRTLEVFKQEEPLLESKSWIAPVRVLLLNDDWRSPDGMLQGSHDEHGDVRPEYLDAPAIYENEQDNIIKEELLDPKCIEANDYNLSAGRYKLFKPIAFTYEPPDKLIRELQGMEEEILSRLDKLLEIVEGRG